MLERSQEEAIALERKIPAQEQQQLQAGTDKFLALWKPANTAEPKGAVIIIPGAGETADWPQAIGPLRRQLPDAQWSSLSITLPDLQSDAIAPRIVEVAPAPKTPDTGSKDSTTAVPIEQAAGGEAEVADKVIAETSEEQVKADAERIFARLDAAVAYAEQQNARSIVVLGHGTGAYWAARYLSERQPSQVQKFVMVAAQTPGAAKPALAELTPTLKARDGRFLLCGQTAGSQSSTGAFTGQQAFEDAVVQPGVAEGVAGVMPRLSRNNWCAGCVAG